MKIWIGTYHGSNAEIAAVESAGFKVGEGSMHVTEPVEGDPWEIAKKIYDAAHGWLKVAVGSYFESDKQTAVQIFVSDDWFHQR